MNTDPAPDADDVVLAYLHAVDAGVAPDPADWLARYPQFADRLAPFFAVERDVGRVRPSHSTAVRHDTPTPDDPGEETPGTLGLGDRYEWGGVLGRGGMGSVVRVRDATLDRRVAVKILRRRHRGSPHLAERFRDEVRIAAGLQHPGVPPVHDVGTAPDGRPFMVMKLIEGSTLADLLARRPDPAHDLPGFLKVFEQIAQTVAYAHSRGVLHRDLKPLNVMVGAFGEVQVMDWGLARAVRNAEFGVRNEEEGAWDAAPVPRSAFRTPNLTAAGTALGTPAYMAPEQARGEAGRIDPRADVFGLGAILCDILTGRPPFTGYDPLAQARRGDVADARRRLDAAACDRELAALARRCLDPDPANRPADGRAVADAITGHLAGVQERLRQTELAGAKATAERQRRRAVRGLGGLAAGALVVGLAAVLAVQTRANADLTQKNTELSAANDRERQRFALALDAIGLFHGEASQDLILKEAQFKPLRAKLLRGAADFYTRLEGQLAGRDDPESQAALAGAYRELGLLHVSLGDLPTAVATWHKALTIQKQLAAAPAANRDTRLAAAGTLMMMGAHQKAFDKAASTATLREAQSVAEAVEYELGETFESRLLVAEIVHLRANLVMFDSRPDEATELGRQALSIYESLHATRPTDPKVLGGLGNMHIQIGMSVRDTMGGVWRHKLRGQSYYQARLDRDPTNLDYRHAVAHGNMALGWTNDSAEVPPETAVVYAEAGRDLAAKLVAEYPAVAEFRRVLALSQYFAGRQYRLLNRRADARAAFETAIGHWQHLCATGDGTYFQYLALTRAFLAVTDLDDGHPDAALRGGQQAEREMVRAFEKTGEEGNQAHRAVIVRRIGLIHLAAGDFEKAAAETRRARDALASMWKKLSHYSHLPVELAACHATLAGLAGKPGSGVPAADAQTEADQAMALLTSDLNLNRPHPNLLIRDPAFAPLRDRADFQKFLRGSEALAEKAKKDAAK